MGASINYGAEKWGVGSSWFFLRNIGFCGFLMIFYEAGRAWTEILEKYVT